MTSRPLANPGDLSAAPRLGTRRWLLFVHQLPSTPSHVRVRTWRRLQQVGAIPLKQTVYVLPDSPGAREDFEWLKTEVIGLGGEASVFAANHLDTWSDDALVDEFRRSRQEAYTALAGEIDRALERLRAARRPRGTRAPAVTRLVEIYTARLAALERIDFFGSAGRDRVVTLLADLGRALDGSRGGPASRAEPLDRTSYTGRLWVTRPRPGVDRMASAWLIRRFVDARARFGFAVDREAAPAESVPFDMYGVELSHRGDQCTFETLCGVFGVADPAVARVAAIVHDLDLKDGRFNPPEASTVSAVIDGLQLAIPDDEALLTQGMTLFESLYRAFEQSARVTGPRPVAGSRARRTDSRKTRARRQSKR